MIFILTLIIVLFIITGCIFSFLNAYKIRNLRLDLIDSENDLATAIKILSNKIALLESQGELDV